MVMAALTTLRRCRSLAGPFADHAVHLAEMLAHLVQREAEREEPLRGLAARAADQAVAAHRIPRNGRRMPARLPPGVAAVCARAARRRWSAGSRRPPARSSASRASAEPAPPPVSRSRPPGRE